MNTNPATVDPATRLSWGAIAETYSTDLAEHLARAQAVGLDCPMDVFEQLFHDQHDKQELASILSFVDWSAVRWEEGELSGVVLRRVGVPRPFEHAVDEARWRTAEEGFSDERPEIMVHWIEAHTWVRAPIVVSGDVLGSLVAYELLVGFTRLGNLLGALDRQDVPEPSRHRIWIGSAA